MIRLNPISSRIQHSRKIGRSRAFPRLCTVLFQCIGLCLSVTAESPDEAGKGSEDSSWFRNAGPLFSRYELSLEDGWRTDVLGPFFHHQTTEESEEWALSPLFSKLTLNEPREAHFDFLYPLVTWDRLGDERRFQIIQLISFSAGLRQSGDDAKRLSLFPFYFQQRSTLENENYTALFPIYGNVKNRFLRDEIRFIAFPAYSETRKRDVVTRNFLYPFVHLRRGEHLRGWQFWPLLGYESREPYTYIDPLTQEESIKPGFESRFFLWPILLQEDSGIGTEDTRRQRAVLPLYYIDRSDALDLTSVIWPFFSYKHHHAEAYREWSLPWPFWTYAKGEGKSSLRFWPVYGRTRVDTLTGTFVAWPLYRSKTNESKDLILERTSLLFYLYKRNAETDKGTGVEKVRVVSWPLFEFRRDRQGNQSTQFPALLEPLLSGNRSIKRNWSPLWTVWRSEANVLNGNRSESLLWNFYRREKTPGRTSVSFLFGLIRYEKDEEGRRFRSGLFRSR